MRRFGMLYKNSKPVIGIFGTSSKQGKFTLQLEMRKSFINKGYKVGQLGTEPNSLLFGMDEVYPMGYNSSVHIKGADAIIYLNNLMESISKKNNDIILVGSQSGTVSYDMLNIAYCCLPEYEFLLGTQPDIVLLCINPFDDINYIMRTINFIESSVDCKVQSLIMFPMNRKKDWMGNFGRLEQINRKDFDIKCKKLEEATKRKVYLLNEEKDVERSVEQLIDVLSEV